VPRDHDASFEPVLFPKHARRFTGFDDKIIALYTRGMTVRDIREFLLEQYGTHISPEFGSSVLVHAQTVLDASSYCQTNQSKNTKKPAITRAYSAFNAIKYLSMPDAESFPFDRRRGFAGDIVDHAGNIGDFVDDAV